MDDCPPLKALCIHGIQSTIPDWRDAEEELSPSLQFEHAQRQFFEGRKVDFETWQSRVIAYESNLIRQGAHNILIAHSYATHRAGLILRNAPDIYGAILINPPSNRLRSDVKHPVRSNAPQDSTFMNTLFHNITFDMNDERYAQFINRQELAYANEQREISRQAAYLKNGPLFQSRLGEIPEDKEILILRSSGDAWDVGEIAETEKRVVVDLGPEYGHYPHVSRPEDVSQFVRSWLKDRIFSNDQAEPSQFKYEAVAFG